MKNALLVLLVLFSGNSFAQKSDTLIVPVGKYKFIKIGDKIYEIEIKLKEVEPLNTKGTFTLPYGGSFTPNYFNQNTLTYPVDRISIDSLSIGSLIRRDNLTNPISK